MSNQTIATREELDALPFESVIRDAIRNVYEKWGEAGQAGTWKTCGEHKGVFSTDIHLPAKLLDAPLEES